MYKYLLQLTEEEREAINLFIEYFDCHNHKYIIANSEATEIVLKVAEILNKTLYNFDLIKKWEE